MRTRTMVVRGAHRTAFTLVEMLVAMAITLVMMAAVVTLFANVSSSIRDSRANLEMGAQIRGVRNVLQQDLAGATCPGLTWQRPESNHGYIELIEGPRHEGDASLLVDGIDQPGSPKFNTEIDHATSILPSSDLPFTSAPGQSGWATDGGGLGDGDDILMLTVRNERKPFVGRVPNIGTAQTFGDWKFDSAQSPLAEVVWFAIENPVLRENINNFFGEPGMRTIYRRTLLIAPWVNPYLSLATNDGLVHFKGNLNVKPVPGLVRILDVESTPTKISLQQAIAGLIAFQDQYDLSVRLDWDKDTQHWKLMANTLGDLTKRENRFGHYGYLLGTGGNNPEKRIFPFPVVSAGSGYSGNKQDVGFAVDPDFGGNTSAKTEANILPSTSGVISYTVTNPGSNYQARPFAFINKAPSGGVPATAWAMLNDDGQVVRVMHGPMPLWGTRRGEDVMLTNVLAFDLRVYDPGAPLFATRKVPGNATSDLDVVLSPSDPGWYTAYVSNDNMKADGSGAIGNAFGTYPFVGQGAYVDLGYGFQRQVKAPRFASASMPDPWFFAPAMELAVARIRNQLPLHGGALIDVYGQQLAPGFSVYDTWSFHYENNGIDEDLDVNKTVDQGTDGLDGVGHYLNPSPPALPPYTIDDRRLGVDDAGERETTPPYDKPLRGIQVLLRSYELDSRAIRQVRVNQHFMAE